MVFSKRKQIIVITRNFTIILIDIINYLFKKIVFLIELIFNGILLCKNYKNLKANLLQEKREGIK